MASKYKWDNNNLPKLSDLWHSGDSLGQKIERMFTRFVQAVFLWVLDFASDRLVDVFDNAMKIMRPGTERVTKGAFNYIKNMPDVPPWMKEVITAAEREEGESSFLIRLGVFYVSIRSIIFGGLEPFAKLANYGADREARSFLPDVQTVAIMKRTGLMSEEGFQTSMNSLGVHDKLKPAYLEFTRNLPNLGDVIAGRWRGKISNDEFRALLHRMGYDDKDIELYNELSQNIPPLTDLIHMLVRDAFNDGAANKYGYDEDFPQEINEFFIKQGYSEEWAKRYWRAHWNLPSPTQAYEMLHRGLIDQTVMDELLKISDYPKFWREKLIGVSYNPFTRVDIRRMFQTGILSEGEVLQAYKEIGYDEEHARKLTDYTVQQISNDEKDLTRTDIVNSYEEGIIDRGAASSGLVKMGYDADEAETILKGADFSISKAMRTDNVNWTKEQYLARAIDRTQATVELSKAGLTSRSVDRYLLSWDRSKNNDVKLLTRAEAVNLYMADIITDADLRQQLLLLKYPDNVIEWLMADALSKKREQGETNDNTQA